MRQEQHSIPSAHSYVHIGRLNKHPSQHLGGTRVLAPQHKTLVVARETCRILVHDHFAEQLSMDVTAMFAAVAWPSRIMFFVPCCWKAVGSPQIAQNPLIADR